MGRMSGRSNFRRLGTWIGVAGLLIQVLIPFIVAFDVTALSPAPPRHAHRLASFDHLRGQQLLVKGEDGRSSPHHGTESPHSQGPHAHVSCPLCLALHASMGALVPSLDLPPDPSPRCGTDGSAIMPAAAFFFPASYRSRAPPALA